MSEHLVCGEQLVLRWPLQSYFQLFTHIIPVSQFLIRIRLLLGRWTKLFVREFLVFQDELEDVFIIAGTTKFEEKFDGFVGLERLQHPGLVI